MTFALARAFPGPAALPWTTVGMWPTAVEPMDALARELGLAAGQLWIKREDLSGGVYGGNKLRSLEPLLGEAQAAFEWIDSTRHFIPPQDKIYSWWSYRAADWEASDRGRRLDHVWASPGLKGTLKSHKIVKKMRGWQKASDHVPVIVEFDV